MVQSGGTRERFRRSPGAPERSYASRHGRRRSAEPELEEAADLPHGSPRGHRDRV